jgi:SOS response regulatory protein OraA/RecX
VPTVTALRAAGDRVVVALDGDTWRTVPVAAVAEAGLAIGVELDRDRARRLGRALRRLRAEEAAVRALARRERSRVGLDARLARAGVAAGLREEVLERAERSGLVDDEGFARRRAVLFAERGAGDALVVDDLLRCGVDESVARAALDALPPEHDRAARVVEQRGSSARTLRYLASRGFSDDVLEPLIADIESGSLR